MTRHNQKNAIGFERNRIATCRTAHAANRAASGFGRQIPVGMDIDENKIEAAFMTGILKAVLPKTERVQTKAKRIAINSPAKH